MPTRFPAMILLVALVLTAACLEEEQPSLPDVRSTALPGQQLVAVGDVTGEGTRGGTIDIITLRIGLPPGVRSVDMRDVTVIYADAVRTETLVPVPDLRGVPPQGSWGILDVAGQEGVTNNLIEFDEVFVIGVNPRAPVVPRQFLTLVLRTPSGPPLTLRRTAPPSILAENILSPA